MDTSFPSFPANPGNPAMADPNEPWLTGTMRGAGRVTQAHTEARRAYVRPLFDYCQSHSIIVIQVVRRAALRMGDGYIPRNRLMRIKNGSSPAPWWFVAEVCREIGLPIEVVMGAEWAQRHLPVLAPDVPGSAHTSQAERAS
jgi:hypothetical protein